MQAGKLESLFKANLRAFVESSAVTIIGAKAAIFPPKSHACVSWGSIEATAASFV